MKRGHLFLALLMLAALASMVVLAGCSGGTDNATDSTNDSSGTQNVDSGEDNASASGEPVSGGAITVAVTTDLYDSLDPHFSSTAGTREILFNIFEGLVGVDSKGVVYPAVAEDYEFSEDGLTLTFTLRDGVKFHNGDTVEADDVIYSIKRCAGLLDDGGEIMVPAFSIIKDVSSPDGKTVVVTLSETNIEIIYYFVGITAAIVPCD